MKGDIVVRKVVQDVMVSLMLKRGLIENAPKIELSFTPDITVDLIKNLITSIFIESDSDYCRWEKFYATHIKRMTSSPFTFAKYVAYACYLKSKGVEDAYDAFLRTMSLVATFVVFLGAKNRRSFLNAYVDLVCAFFEKELRNKFEEQGGWKNFNSFLETQENFQKYKGVVTQQDEIRFLKSLEDKLVKSKDFCKVSGVVLMEIQRKEIENDKSATAFANSIVDEIKQVSNLTINQLLMNFSIINDKVKELYMKQVEEGAACRGCEVEMPASQNSDPDEESAKIPNSNESKNDKKDRVSAPVHFKTGGSSVVDHQDIAASAEASDPDQQTSVMGKAKELLQDMLKDIDKISHLLMFIFEENDVKHTSRQ